MAASGVVEAEQVAARVLRPAVVVARTSAISPSRNSNHSVPRSIRRSPDSGWRQVIVHSIATRSPSLIASSIVQRASIWLTPNAA